MKVDDDKTNEIRNVMSNGSMAPCIGARLQLIQLQRKLLIKDSSEQEIFSVFRISCRVPPFRSSAEPRK
jgi:hypothetical protein